MTPRRAWIGVVVFLALYDAAPSIAEELRGGVLGYGPTPAAGIAGGGWVLRGTVGQAVVGTSADRTQILNHGFWCFGGSRVLAVEEPVPGPALPTAFGLGRAAPNPTRGDATFVVALPRPGYVTLRIHDVQGRTVEKLVDRPFDAGYHSLLWKPSCGAGVYFAHLVVDGVRIGERRVIVLP